MTKRCPKCGRFMEGVFKECYAKKQTGETVIIILSGFRCNVCDFLERENYQDKIKSFNFLPFNP